LTSFDTIRKVKAKLGIKKIGHTGTLDKFADGLLIFVTGNYTRLASLFQELPKEYVARIQFGTTTDTLDPEGAITATGPIPTYDQIEKILPDFLGEIEQVPPLFSAVHHEGERAYKLVRSGKTPELKARKITIYNLSCIDYNPPYLTLKVNCSKGTYIRSLARDMGIALGSCGYVVNLTRTCVGGFLVTQACTIDAIDQYKNDIKLSEIAPKLANIGKLTIKDEYYEKILTGSMVHDDFFIETSISNNRYLIFDLQGDFLAFIEKTINKYNYFFVIGKSGS